MSHSWKLCGTFHSIAFVSELLVFQFLTLKTSLAKAGADSTEGLLNGPTSFPLCFKNLFGAFFLFCFPLAFSSTERHFSRDRASLSSQALRVDHWMDL